MKLPRPRVERTLSVRDRRRRSACQGGRHRRRDSTTPDLNGIVRGVCKTEGVSDADEVRAALKTWIVAEQAKHEVLGPFMLGDEHSSPPLVLTPERAAAIAAADEAAMHARDGYVETCKRVGWPYPHYPTSA